MKHQMSQVLGLADVPAYPEPAETERTFEGNALLKARACVAASGLPALADDSGLAVDVLNQMPGVRSARWAGPGASDEENNALCCASWTMSRQPSGLPGSSVRWRWCFRMVPNTSGSVRCEAGCVSAPLGDNGFGYDPLFVADGNTVTNGELEPAAKDAISHRGRAVRAILPVLIAELRRLEPCSIGQLCRPSWRRDEP